MNEKLVKAILSYGNRYRNGILLGPYGRQTKEDLQEQLIHNRWEALKFFFGRAFFQGRSDKVSERVYVTAMGALEAESDLAAKCFAGRDLDLLGDALRKVIGLGKVGKGGDIKMVISTFDHVSKLPAQNIVAHSLAAIVAGEIGRQYEELQVIFQVGPKIASFYLRDVVSLFNLESAVPDDFQFCLQPIDVWVKKLAMKTGMVVDGDSDNDVRQAIVRVCGEYGCSPLQFNQGAWYAGYYAFDLLLETLAALGLE